MPITEPRIDAYIEQSAAFAKPILQHIRKLVHKACPEVEEKIKWGHPFFDYKGGPLCNLAAFKEHCGFGFWKAKLMKDPDGIFNKGAAMGQFDRITSVKDLPSDKTIIAYIKEAGQLNEAGIKVSKPKSVPKEFTIPEGLIAALKKHKKANSAFEKFPPSHKKEYAMWIAEAKTEVTKNKRIECAVEMISEGKSRNWKYEKK